MKTWRLMVNVPPVAELMMMALQQRTSPDSIALENRTETAVWQWDINSSSENENMMVEHQDMIRYNKGDKVFWFDGGANADLRSRVFIGTGNGVQVQWQMPFRWVYPSSLVISVNNVTQTSWALSGKAITFGSAPVDGSLIHIEKARMRFKCYFVVENDKAYEMMDNFKSFESKDIRIREFPN